MKWIKTSEKLPNTHRRILMGGFDNGKEYLEVGYLHHVSSDGIRYWISSEIISTAEFLGENKWYAKEPYIWMYIHDIGLPPFPLEEQ